MLEYVVKNGDASASRISVVSERPQISGWHAAPLAVPAITLHGLLERQTRQTPAATAVQSAKQCWSYAELERRATRVALALARHDVAPRAFVGVLMARDAPLLAALFGVLKRGAAYVPLDAQWPSERIAYVARDARITTLLVDHVTWQACGDALLAAQAADEQSTAKLQPLFVDDLLSTSTDNDGDDDIVDVQPDWLAYVLYTSGTTGRPKGVCVQHNSVVNEVYYMGTSVVKPEEMARTLFATSVCFDASVDEIFLPLSFGGALLVVNNMLALCDVDMSRTPVDVDDAFTQQLRAVTLLNGTPSAVQMLIETQHVPLATRVVLLGGEAMTRRTAEALFALLGDGIRLYNVYGPTEATDLCLIEQVGKGGQGAPLLGSPIANMRAHVVSARTLIPQPVGVPGELIIQVCALLLLIVIINFVHFSFSLSLSVCRVLVLQEDIGIEMN
jgi:non-ribosomal peptide synthetase component F